MERQQSSVETIEKFTWVIDNFSKLDNKKLYSETVIMGGYPWRILLFPHGNEVNSLSIYLDAADSAQLPEGWSRVVNCKLAVLNQVDDSLTITKKFVHEFNAKQDDWGFKYFLLLSRLRDPHKGFLVEDTCMVSAEISFPNSHENVVNQAASTISSLTSGGQAGNIEVETPSAECRDQVMETLSPISTLVSAEPDVMGMSSTSIGELMDFRGLGQIEKAFVPLLEEVCSQHPSLIECQQNRSRKFIEWAFTALGRVLHFLKTRKVKDMGDLTCKDLQILWEELETFRFDLTWLEPHVQSALGIKSYVEKAMEVEKLKENVAALELEMKKLEAKVVAAEVNLDGARNLLKVEGYEEKDLDAELGYGIS